jgi:serine/threonine protein kinase
VSTPIALERRPSALAAGVLVAGRYRLTQPIGAGGMAQVWKAAHEDLRVDVAIKFLDPKLASDPQAAPVVLGRFRFEAQVSAQLAARTQHVVAVHDAGSHRGIPYLVMQLVTGRDLEREVEVHGPLSPQSMADVVDQIADALEAAHAIGIVHRDLKPSNVLLMSGEETGRKWSVKVADFGVAKAVDPKKPFDLPRETAHGLLVGSPSFMSPEQAAGESTVDARSDIWSLGVLVYECLTGKVCFDGKSLTETLVSVAMRRYSPLRSVAPQLGSRVDAWMDRCLALDPAGRFQSAREAARVFREAVSGIEESPPSVIAPGSEAAAGARRKWALVALVSVPVLLAIGLLVWRDMGAETSAATAPSAAPSTTSQAAAPDAPASAPVTPVVSAAPSPADTPVHSTSPRPVPGPSSAATPTSASVAPPPSSAAVSTEAPTAPVPSTVATPAKWPQKKVDPSEVH